MENKFSEQQEKLCNKCKIAIQECHCHEEKKRVSKVIMSVDEDLKVWEVKTEVCSIFVIGKYVEQKNKRAYKIDYEKIIVTDSNICSINEVCTVNEFNYISTHYSTLCMLPEGLKKYIEEVVLDEYRHDDISHLKLDK